MTTPFTSVGTRPLTPTAGAAPAPALFRAPVPTGFETTIATRRLQRAAVGGTTVPQAFDALFAHLEITDAEQKRASAQQQSVRKKLNAELVIEADYLSGSYRRRTLVRPLHDIDLLVVLDAEVYGLDEDFDPADAYEARAMLDRLEDAIEAAYPNTERKRHDRCVQLLFSGSGIGFDVVPAVRFTEGEFWIPDARRGRWIKTNPREVQRLVSEANQGPCDGWLVPLVKLLKCWARTVGAPLTGFHLEAMAYRALTRAPATEREGLAYLFNALAVDVLATTPDIWPAGEPASAYLSSADRETAYTLLSDAALDAEAAVTAEAQGETQEAHRLWFGLMGDRYPEPGVARAALAPVSGLAAVQAIRAGAYVSATSSGVTAAAAGYAGVRSSTSHGGALEGLVDAADADAAPLDAAQRDRLEREIAAACAQFTRLRRVTPEAAADDPTLWPVRAGQAHRLHAVLVGEQRSNLTGRWHRILVTVPKNAPATEPRVYALDQHVRHRPLGDGRWTPVRPRRHQWDDGAMCTHALRDRCDGRLVTVLVMAADWLVRQDHYQLTGRWIGREVGPKGLRVNGRVPGAPARVRRRASTRRAR